MARSEAQRAADKRYASKNKNKYEHFVVHLKPEEYERISSAIEAAGMSKADFLRWAITQLTNK